VAKKSFEQDSAIIARLKPVSPDTKPTRGPPTRRSMKAWWAINFAAVIAIVGGGFGGLQYTRWQEAKRVADVEAAKKKADEDIAKKAVEEREHRDAFEAAQRAERAEQQRREEEAKRKADQDAQRQADAAASVKKAEEEVQARARAEAKRRADEIAKRQEETKQRAEEEAKREAWKPLLDRVLTAAEEERLKPGDEFQECKDCPRMIVVPAGSFMMGSNDGDADEKPMHKVTIARPFAVGKFDVTFAEWDACVAAGGCKHMPQDRGWGRGTRPVINVSWDDIMKEYLPWLSRKTGKTYRLLTEAEWEYAARGVIDASAVHTNYSWGNDVGKNLANCNGCGSQWDAKQSAPVGSFKPNTFGLYDIHGNVRQWVQDCYHDSYQGAPADGSAWVTSCTDGSRRVLRGGSWHVDPQDLRAAYRVANSAGKRIDAEPAHSAIIDDDGFRVARTLTKDAATQEAANSAIKNSMPSHPVVAIDRTPAPARCDGVEVQVGSERKCLKPKDSFRDCPTCPEMVVVPAGKFSMGSPAGEKNRSDDEGPQHEVTIGKAFAVGRFAVTRGEFAAFVRDTGHKTEGGCYAYIGSEWKQHLDQSWRSPGFEQDDRHPVVCVNWDDAKAFGAWLARKTAKPYRLLSEAEREYATRAATTTPFWWGSSISTAQANYDGNYTYGDGSKGEWRKGTLAVDSFKANPWGLYNVHGNVWDWVEDCYHDRYQGAPTDGSAWITGYCGRRVVRGGSWDNNPKNLRAAFRSARSTVDRFSLHGFRLARTISAELNQAVKLPTAPPTLSPDCRTKRVAGDLFRLPLRALSRAVRAKRQVRVLAIGSSSTAGVGASSSSATYIAKLQTFLEGSLQGMDFDVVGRGRSGEVAQGAADRMKHEVEETKPDLVVWELGTNDALRHVSLDKFKACVNTTLAWLAENKIDVVLIDPQYGETLTMDTYYEQMVGAVAEVAREARVLLVDRFEAMRELQRERGDLFYLSSDQLHPNDRGHRCMAEQLARAIVGGLMQADAEQTQPVYRTSD
jgi:formylglycine-generating enzyme required for sulfatase activity/lysophospholipase L1-like esterase